MSTLNNITQTTGRALDPLCMRYASGHGQLSSYKSRLSKKKNIRNPKYIGLCFIYTTNNSMMVPIYKFNTYSTISLSSLCPNNF